MIGRVIASPSDQPPRGEQGDDEYRHAFPSGDPVAQFVVALAAASNDLQLANSHLSESSGYLQLWWLREVLRRLWQTHVLVQGSVAVEAVEAFVDRIAEAEPGTGASPDGVALVAILKGDEGVSEPRIRNALRMARDWTPHYPQPADPALSETLRKLASQTMPKPSGRDESSRFEFADEVMARMAFPFPESVAEERLTQLLASAGDAARAIVHLAHTGLGLWLDERIGCTE